MKKFFQEFKEFATKGNAMQLAVGVIIGGAFQAIVTSLTTDILSPIIGLFAGKNFDGLFLQIGGVTLTYGAFLTAVINFLITAFVVFLLVKLLMKLSGVGKKEEPAVEATPTTKTCPYCRSDIHIEATRCPNCTSVLE